ncbi:MAG: PQQ-like beta-propeller repeat protein, partial [Gemmatimonadaceae bacterium]|nr:PQQ-like beta-propeller repeat protein [Gemmatimonadaceae bacterium]
MLTTDSLAFVITSPGSLVALRPADGTTIWERPIASPDQPQGDEVPVWRGTLRVVGERIIQVHPLDTWALDANTGALLWRTRAPRLVASDDGVGRAAIGERWAVIPRSDGRVTRIDLRDGTRSDYARRFLPFTGNGRSDGVTASLVSGDTVILAEVAPSPRGLRFGTMTLWQLDARTGDSLLATRMPDDTTTANFWFAPWRDLVIAPSS